MNIESELGMEKILLYFSLKYEGDFSEILNAVRRHERIDYELYEQLTDNFECSYTTIISEDYPERLKEIVCPPFVLFYKGNLSVLDRQTISINGTKDPSSYGEECTKKYAVDLADKDVSIITGLQKGIGSIALNELIKSDKTDHAAAVLPCGIKMCYPSENHRIYDELAKYGLVISEYPFDTKYTNNRMLQRLRITSGLSDKLLITELKTEHKSSSMIEVGWILDQGKDAYAVPASILEKDYQGCNILIQQGAGLTTHPDDMDFAGNNENKKTYNECHEETSRQRR